MSLRVLEFNDAGVRLSDENGLLLSSPGYALVLPKQIEFGESARQQSRINPLNSYNQFWHKLSLDPFARPLAHYQHNAHLAFSHIEALANTAQKEGDVLLAVPGSFSREQMAILLGVMQKSPFRAVGIVDAALAAVVEHSDGDVVIHADLQLHQVVLTKLQRNGADLQRESVVVVPGTGWVNISDSLIQLATNAFIQQCRFNPQHNAESEQMLLDAVPHWLQEELLEATQPFAAVGEADETRRSLQIRLSHKNSVHEASLPRNSLATRLHSYYQKIAQQLALLDPTGRAPLLLSDRMQILPGLQQALQGLEGQRPLRLLPENTIAASSLRFADSLVSEPDAVHFVSALRAPTASVTGAVAAQVQPAPTHLLMQHRARRLQDGLQVCPGVQLRERNGRFLLHASAAVQLNGKTLSAPQVLHLGDVIRAEGMADAITLVWVEGSDE